MPHLHAAGWHWRCYVSVPVGLWTDRILQDKRASALLAKKSTTHLDTLCCVAFGLPPCFYVVATDATKPETPVPAQVLVCGVFGPVVLAFLCAVALVYTACPCLNGGSGSLHVLFDAQQYTIGAVVVFPSWSISVSPQRTISPSQIKSFLLDGSMSSDSRSDGSCRQAGARV